MRHDFLRTFPLGNGSEIQLVLADDGSQVKARTPAGEEIGRLDFRECDGAYFLMWAHLDRLEKKFTRRGIGRAALKFHIEVFGCPILTTDHDGIRRDDGAHLTGDAPGFVAKMRAEGLIAPALYDSADDADGE